MKKSKTVNKNSLKNLYNELNHSYNSQIVDVISKTKITSNIGNFLMKYKTATIILTIVYIALVIFAFHQSPKLILYSILLAIFLIIIMTINSTYKLELLEKGLKLTQLATKELIPYEELFTITLLKSTNRLFLIPIVTTKDETIRTIELPIIMLRPKQLRDFMNSFEFEIDEKEEEKTQEELDKREKRILKIFIAIVIIILVISLITGIAIMLKRK